MSLSNTTKFANRLGLDIKFYAYNGSGTLDESATPLLEVDFANEVSLEASDDNAWATGGQKHGKKIAFKNLPEGTFKISTQIENILLKKLAAGEDISDAGSDLSVKFGTSASKVAYYIITGDTLWQDEDGVTYTEHVVIYKACVKNAINATWTGDGDPQSRDIEFELGLNDNGDMFKIEYADQAND